MSFLSRLIGQSSHYEEGDLVVFTDQDGETQYGTFEGYTRGGVLVTQQTDMPGFKRLVQPVEPQPKDGE